MDRTLQPALPPVPFVMGVARSGTTLLRLMLDAHPALAIPAETGILHLAPHLCAGAPSDTAGLRNSFADMLLGSAGWPDLGTTEDELAVTLARVEPFTVADGIRAFFGRYAAERGKRRWGEKTPSHVACIDLLFSLLPEARAIHIIRDGRDVAVSVRPLWFRPGDTIEELATDWRDQIEAARRLAAGSAAYLEVRYERLVADPVPELRRVCAMLDLPFEPQMLRYHRTARGRLGEVCDRYDEAGRLVISKEDRLRNHRFATRPPTPERTGRWRHELTPDEQAAFEEIAGDLLDDLGYPTGPDARRSAGERS